MQITLCESCAKQLEPKIELKVGHFYLARKRGKAALINYFSPDKMFPCRGIILGDDIIYSWVQDGSFTSVKNNLNDLDLVKEITHEEALKILRGNNEKL